MDGDIAPLAEPTWLAAPVPPDGRRGARDRRLGPGGRGSVAAAGLTRRGRRGRRDARQGARLLRRLRLRHRRDWSTSWSTPPARSSSRPRPRPRPSPPPGPRSGAARRAARAVERAAGERGCAPARDCAPTVGIVETQIVPLVIGDADDAMALCERLLGGRLRAGDPAADGPARDLPPAPDGDGDPPDRRAAARPRG